MVDALRHIHQSLVTDGLLLDVHPEPVNSRVEVWQEHRVIELGEIDQAEDNHEIEDARSRLGLLIANGLFVPEVADTFELSEHHDSVTSWQNRWAYEGYRLEAPPEMLESAEAILSSEGGELVIREQVRATRLRRLA